MRQKTIFFFKKKTKFLKKLKKQFPYSIEIEKNHHNNFLNVAHRLVVRIEREMPQLIRPQSQTKVEQKFVENKTKTKPSTQKKREKYIYSID